MVLTKRIILPRINFSFSNAYISRNFSSSLEHLTRSIQMLLIKREPINQSFHCSIADKYNTATPSNFVDLLLRISTMSKSSMSHAIEFFSTLPPSHLMSSFSTRPPMATKRIFCAGSDSGRVGQLNSNV